MTHNPLHGALVKLKKTFLPSPEVGAQRRQRVFGTTSKAPAIAAGLVAGASVTPIGRAVVSALGSTYVGKRLGLGLAGASVFSGLKSFASEGSLNIIPSAKQSIYGAGLAIHPIAGVLGIAAGESVALAKKATPYFERGFEYTKEKFDEAQEAAIKYAYEPAPYGSPYVLEREREAVMAIAHAENIAGQAYGYGKEILQEGYGAVSSYVQGFGTSFAFPTIQTASEVTVRGLEGLKGFGEGALGDLKAFAQLMGISLVALLAYLGIKRYKKKKRRKK